MKTMRNTIQCLVLFGLLFALGLPVAATAQGQPKIHIHNVVGPSEITDPNGLPALRTTVDFTLLNDADEVMAGIALASSTLDLDDGSRNPAPVTDITEPWSVALVLDNSRTLFVSAAFNDLKAARDDAINAVGALPEGTNIAVLTVSDKITITQNFTAKKEDVQTAILRQPKRKTCRRPSCGSGSR
jgi:hypothetical protein